MSVSVPPEDKAREQQAKVPEPRPADPRQPGVYLYDGWSLQPATVSADTPAVRWVP